MPYDVLITNGRLLDASRGLDAVGDLAILGGRIVDAAPGYGAEQTIDAAGCLVVPGLIDFHCHVFFKGSLDGVPADAALLPQGVTTAVDAGSSGIANYELFYRSVVANSIVRVKAYLSLAATGIITGKFDENVDPGDFNERKVRELFAVYPGALLGLKLRTSRELVGELGLAPLKAALQIATAVDCPLVVHPNNPPCSTSELIELFRPGDVFTHCFHGKGETIVGADGRVLPAVKAARRRGVVFDASNGRSNFAFRTARAALADGFAADIISSDLSTGTMYKAPTYGLPFIVSKYLNMGLPLADAFAACTSVPAQHMGMQEEIGTLAAGACADVAIFKLAEAPVDFVDIDGEVLQGDRYLVPQATLRSGQVVYRQAGFW